MLLYVSLGSRVSTSIFSLMIMGSVVLVTCNESYVMYSAGSGVTRVHVVLSGLRIRLFVSMYVLPLSMIECWPLICLRECALMLW